MVVRGGLNPGQLFASWMRGKMFSGFCNQVQLHQLSFDNMWGLSGHLSRVKVDFFTAHYA